MSVEAMITKDIHAPNPLDGSLNERAPCQAAQTKLGTKTILLAHGSSDPSWSAAFVTLAAPTLSEISDTALAYMELSEPSLESEVERAKAEGYNSVQVLPLFLAKGRHLKKDVPEMLDDYQSKYQIETSLLNPIGEHPLIATAINDIVKDTLQSETQAHP